MTVNIWTNEKRAEELKIPDHRVMMPRIGVAIIAVKGDKILALKRHRDSLSGPGCWSIPGGKLDFDERIHDCALRELQEETGIVEHWTTFHNFAENMFPTEVDGTPMHWLTMYVIVPTNKEPQIMEPDKCEELVWMYPDEFINQDNLFLPNRGLLAKDRFAYHKAVERTQEFKAGRFT